MPLEGQRQSVENIRNRSVLIVFGRGLVGALLPVATITLQIRAVVLRAIGTAQATPVRILILLPVRRIRSTFLVHPRLSTVTPAHRAHALPLPWSHPVTALSTAHRRHKSIATLPTSALARLIHPGLSTPATAPRTRSHALALSWSHSATALPATHPRHKSIAARPTSTFALGRLVHHRRSTPTPAHRPWPLLPHIRPALATTHRPHALSRSHSATTLAATHSRHKSITTLPTPASLGRLIHHGRPAATPAMAHRTRSHTLAPSRTHSVTALSATHGRPELPRALSTRRLIPSAAPLAIHGTRMGAEIAIAAAGTIGILARTKIPLRSTLSARAAEILLASAIAPGGLAQGGDR